ncbi:MAG: type II toxin-antitoxin system PemK/MazF family toxin [Verrucomicrobia bacterium]|nr:type II toxin-antitoxin system PemK/MazF family toxin [Verrucomicrobiota bacterium]
MPPARYSQGDILLVSLVFSNQTGLKRRPVMVVYDSGDADLLVVPVTSHGERTALDVPLMQWQNSGLRLASVVRVEKLATIEKTTIVRALGRVSAADWPNIEAALRCLWRQILPAV